RSDHGPTKRPNYPEYDGFGDHIVWGELQHGDYGHRRAPPNIERKREAYGCSNRVSFTRQTDDAANHEHVCYIQPDQLVIRARPPKLRAQFSPSQQGNKARE